VSTLTALAWPTAAVIAMFIFRKPITSLLYRVQKVSTSGIEATPPRQEPTSPELKPSSAADRKMFDNAFLVQREELIRLDLERRGIASAERERSLIRFLAAAGIMVQFDRTYYLIWGSQIRALQVLNSSGSAGADASLLQPAYEMAAKQDPLVYANYTFNQWLDFFVQNALIKLEGSKVTITIEGREFLKYLVERGYVIYKPF